MLTLTDNARTVIRRLITRVDGSKRAGLRIAYVGDADQLGIEIATEPEPGDEIVDSGGTRIFVAPRALPSVQDKELHAWVDATSVQFIFRDRVALLS